MQAQDVRSHFGECPIVTTSGGFDPLHAGHVRCLRAAAELWSARYAGWAPLVVIVNGDGFLRRKKGRAFMPLEQRLEIVASIKGVTAVVPWDDGSQTVTGALKIIRPQLFAKGGDRDCAQNVPEYELCRRISCEVVFGVGGGKVASSSALIAGAKENAC